MSAKEIALADKVSAALQSKDAAKATDAAVSVLMHGKSRDLDTFIKRGTETEAVALTLGVRELNSRAEKDVNGVAVGIYAILSSPLGISGRALADAAGMSHGRPSQLSLRGRIIATLGLAEGWKNPLPTSAYETLTSGKAASEVRAILDAGGPVTAQRSAIVDAWRKANATEPGEDAGKRRGPKSKASKKGANVGGSQDTSAGATITDPVSVFEQVSAVLSASWESLDAEAQRRVMAVVAGWLEVAPLDK